MWIALRYTFLVCIWCNFNGLLQLNNGRITVREKDITEKALENYDEVFADIVNALVFDGEKIVKGTELEQVLPKEAYNNSEG